MHVARDLPCADAWLESRTETKSLAELPTNARRLSQSPTLLESIKNCGIQKDLVRGSAIPANCVKGGLLQQDIYVGTALLGMYSKCSALAKAQIVFDDLQAPDVVSWNVLISLYIEHGQANEALQCFERLQNQGLTPNAVTYVCLMKACGLIGAVHKGEQMHIEARRQGLLENNALICTAVVDMYAKCGHLAKAREVFNELSSRDVVSWNVLIGAYAQHRLNEEVLRCFGCMRDEGISPNVVTYVYVLKVCSNIRAVILGQEIHDEVSKLGGLKNNLVLGTALVDMYSKCGELTKAQEVFDDLSERDVPLWNALISGYSNYGQSDKALTYYRLMQKEGLLPNAVTLVSILKACGNLRAIDKGRTVHAEINRLGHLGRDLVLGTALMDMYAKCGDMTKARIVFDELPVQDVTCWTALIAGYTQQQLGVEALSCFDLMREAGLSPNHVTFACILNACGSLGAVEKDLEVHADVDRQVLSENNIVVGSALVDMYAKCGLLAKAQAVLDKMPTRDVTSWTALMAGYTRCGFHEEALVCYERMREEGIFPDLSNFLCIVRACGSLGLIEKGTLIHSEVREQGILHKHSVLGITLVDMYAKCGALKQAISVFDDLPVKETVAWTALISAYAQLGKASCVFDLVTNMRGYFIEPNDITFIVLLNMCSHTGLVEEGQKYFRLMTSFHQIIPNPDHYTCMVDMFCRAGLFETAVSLIESLPASNCQLFWLSLLSACGRWANAKLGRMAFDCALHLDDNYVAPYVFAYNLSVMSGMQE